MYIWAFNRSSSWLAHCYSQGTQSSTMQSPFGVLGKAVMFLLVFTENYYWKQPSWFVETGLAQAWWYLGFSSAFYKSLAAVLERRGVFSVLIWTWVGYSKSVPHRVRERFVSKFFPTWGGVDLARLPEGRDILHKSGGNMKGDYISDMVQ